MVLCYNMGMKKYESLNVISNVKSVCLISHIEPDPDALASLVVFREFIKNHFKVKTVDIFAQTHGLSDTVSKILDKVSLNNKPKKYNMAIMIDCPNSDRLGEYKYLFENANCKIVIDHHATNDYSGDINIVEICSSTCEIISEILNEFKYKLSPSQQGKLYSGIITDTNNFSVGYISARTFKIVSELAPNININTIYRTFLANKTLKNLQLQAFAINNIVTFEHNQIVITHLTHEDAKRLKATHNDFHGIVNHIATVNTAKLICFIEPRDDVYYVSMRAKNGYDVSKIAKENGGGGHVGAAAFETNLDLKTIEQNVLTSFRKELENRKIKKEKLF